MGIGCATPGENDVVTVVDRAPEPPRIVWALDLDLDEEVLTHSQALKIRLAAALSPQRRVVLSLLLLGQHMAGWDLVAFDQTAGNDGQAECKGTTRAPYGAQSSKRLHGLDRHRKPSRNLEVSPFLNGISTVAEPSWTGKEVLHWGLSGARSRGPLAREGAPPSEGIARGAGSFLTVTDTYYGEAETNEVWLLDLRDELGD